jgi:hypothetical protein
VVKWAYENGCVLLSDTCTHAAAGGHANILNWAVSMGCTPKIEMCMCVCVSKCGGCVRVCVWVCGANIHHTNQGVEQH